MDPREGNTNRKRDRRARLTRERRVCTKRNVPSPEAPRRSLERGNTRRSIVEDRSAACESPPSRIVSECAGTSVVRLSVERSKSAWSANLTLCARVHSSSHYSQKKRREWRPRQAEATRDERDSTRGTIRLICTNHPCCRHTVVILHFLWKTVDRYTGSSDTNKLYSSANRAEDHRSRDR